MEVSTAGTRSATPSGDWALDDLAGLFLSNTAMKVGTVKPGPAPGRMGRVQVLHLDLWTVARGIQIGLSTRPCR